MHKISFLDLQPDYMQMEMTNFVRKFTPRSWWQWLTPEKIQLWAYMLQRSAFGEVHESLFSRLGIHGKPFGGVGTWFMDSEGVYYVWVGAGDRVVWKVPEWGLGVWSSTIASFQICISPFADWSNDFQHADIVELKESLLDFSRGHRVFEALGILGGIWSPAEGVAPNEKTLDNPL